jgi:dethiobiotin synthetase
MQSAVRMKAIFVAGTDTGVGKTLVAGLLAGYFIGKGKSVVTQKWVATGKADDIKTHWKIMGFVPKESREVILPYTFKLAASPHLAAGYNRKHIDKEKIRKSFLILLQRHDVVVVEGTGGLLVPIDTKSLLIDIVKDLKLPVLLVSHNKIGAINHTLLSIEALKRRSIPVIGLVFNNLSKTKKIILEDNQRIIREISGIPVLGALPRSNNVNILRSRFKTIGDKIDLSQLAR